METRNCQNCKKDFTIEPDDFSFYEKVKVPPPTFCFPCRLQRKLIFRNERGLYKAVCDMCSKKTLSVVPNSPHHKVYCVSCWTSDEWSREDFAKEYDFSQPFFKQIKGLLSEVPVRALATSSTSLVNSEYCNTSSNLKNCYLVYGSDEAEDCMYSTEVVGGSHRCIDSMIVSAVSDGYEAVNCDHCATIRFSVDCKNCINVSYSKNLSNCSDCIGCCNMSNKQFCIFNIEYTKEDYEARVKKFQFDTKNGHQSMQKQARDFFLTFPNKFMHGFGNNESTADYLHQTKNVRESFIMTGCEDCAYCYNIVVPSAKDCMDYVDWGANATNIYESQSCGANVSDLKFCLFVAKNSMQCEYSTHCANCQYIFGCVGLRNKQYCILNKQYTKEEYEALVPKIKVHMDEMPYTSVNGNSYVYGEFFPPELSLFPYDDSTAHDIFTLSKDEAEAKGYAWSGRIRTTSDALSYALLPEIADAGDEVTKSDIECQNKENMRLHSYCTGNYRITDTELQFYKRHGIPLPQKCFNCRFHARFQYRNPPFLFSRSCMNEGCSNTFKTSYSPERPDIVYCESCYQKEVL